MSYFIYRNAVNNKNLERENIKLDELYIDKNMFVFQNKAKFTDEYYLFSQIGSGTFGIVSKWMSKRNSNIRAVKMIAKSNLSKRKLTEIAKEVEIIKDLDHPNIVKIYESYEDHKYLYIVTEYI